jgi:hypothetical protein
VHSTRRCGDRIALPTDGHDGVIGMAIIDDISRRRIASSRDLNFVLTMCVPACDDRHRMKG